MDSIDETILTDPPPLNEKPVRVLHADAAPLTQSIDEVTLINPPALNEKPTRVIHQPYS